MDGLDYAVLGPHFGGPVRFSSTHRAPSVTRWQRGHPILRFASWDQVHIAEARQVQDSGGLVSVVDADTGPLVLAGERHGGRVVQLAFDPFASDLPMRVAWPVLILNTVGWLTTGDLGASEAHVVATGTPYIQRVANSVTTASFLTPDGIRQRVEVDAGLLRFSDTDRVGMYEVRAGDLQARFAANLLSAAESRIEPQASLGLSQQVGEARIAQLSAGRREIWRPLLLLALLLLVVEWWAFNRRRAA